MKLDDSVSVESQGNRGGSKQDRNYPDGKRSDSDIVLQANRLQSHFERLRIFCMKGFAR